MKIAIDLGHGVGTDRGAVGLIAEEEIIDNVGGLVINKLKELGHTVIEVRPSQASSVSNSLIQRVQKANSNNVDLYVSIHANAGGGKGCEVYTYQARELQQARNVLNNLVSLGFTDRGIKGSNLFVINHTKAPSMLIEVCFVDTQSDVELYQSIGANVIANAIVEGIDGHTASSNVNRATNQQQRYNVSNSHLRDLQSAYNRVYSKNILVDGIWGTQSNNAVNNIVLKQGSKNDLVAWVQIRISNKISVDGIFGNATKQAVMEYQKAHGLVVDGIVGANTLKTILKQYGVKFQ